MAKKMKKETDREISITGYVEEIELENGETGLQIDDGDHVYLIVMDKTGSKLEHYVDEEVDVTGLMTQTADTRELRVSEFSLTDDYYDDEDDSYESDDEDFFDEDDQDR